MSYDLSLFRIPPGVDPRAALEAQRATWERPELNPGEPTVATEALKRRLAESLMELNPSLEVFAFNFGEIAAMQHISVDEAHVQWRHLELNGPEDGNGIQITIYDKEAGISVPYWHTGKKAEQVFTEVWSYLRLLQREGKYVTYDSQLERILDLSSDMVKVLARYEEGVGMLGQMVSNVHRGESPVKGLRRGE